VGADMGENECTRRVRIEKLCERGHGREWVYVQGMDSEGKSNSLSL
jgi:hypothetical protein